jgi:hypothetical protein
VLAPIQDKLLVPAENLEHVLREVCDAIDVRQFVD